MNHKRYTLCSAAAALVLAALMSLPHTAYGQSRPKRTDVGAPATAFLWVGNSFFYYNNSMHNHVGNLARAADQVFVSSPALLEPKRKQNPHTEYSPHGVDVALFQRALDPDLPVAEGARHLRRPCEAWREAATFFSPTGRRSVS